MNWKCYAGAVSLFVLGLLMGGHSGNGSYLKGRLSACNDIMSTAIPPQYHAECEIQGNDVIVNVKTLHTKFSLKGDPL